MKKISFIALCISSFFFACQKETSKTVVVENNSPNIPEGFTKKVLLEEFTGEWCVNCPDGASILHGMTEKYPTKLIVAAVHQGDWLQIAQLTQLSTHLGGIAGYPRASINRVPAAGTTNNQDGMVVYSRGNWETNVVRLMDAENQKTAKIGLGIESSITNNLLSLKVHTGFKTTDARDTRLTVYLVEDSVQAQSQTGATTNPYFHQHVLRKVLSGPLGDSIQLNTGNYAFKTYDNIDISAYKQANLKIIAFINVIGSSSTTHEVINVQGAIAGKSQLFD
jgi:thiol-disulfide isomerase/thioredoxin